MKIPTAPQQQRMITIINHAFDLLGSAIPSSSQRIFSWTKYIITESAALSIMENKTRRSSEISSCGHVAFLCADEYFFFLKCGKFDWLPDHRRRLLMGATLCDLIPPSLIKFIIDRLGVDIALNANAEAPDPRCLGTWRLLRHVRHLRKETYTLTFKEFKQNTIYS